MKVVILHYHMRKGGVTSVILNALSVLLPHKDIEHITILTGEHPTTSMLKEFQDNIPKEHIESRLTIRTFPCLGYYTDGDEIDEQPNVEITKVLNTFLDAPNTILWAHNHHLGKNPHLTKTLISYLARHDTPAILELHDFPEAGRFENMQHITRIMPLSDAYNNTSHAIFAVINSHDRAVLSAGNLAVSLLPNIVFTDQQNHEPRPVPTTVQNNAKKAPHLNNIPRDTRLKQQLAAQCPEFLHIRDKQITNTGSYNLFTYPVRCIRRKNVLEAALLTKLYEHTFKKPSAFCITLAGTSSQERGYSQKVLDLFSSQHISGFYNVGNTLASSEIDFTDICRASDLILASSTQEGFGFSYLAAVEWGRPLLARKISVSEDIMPLLVHWNNHWYERVIVPKTVIPKHDLLRINASYQNKLKTLHKYYSTEKIHALSLQVQALLNAQYIDYSFLSVHIQAYLIEQCSTHESLCNTLAEHNLELLNSMHSLVQYQHSQQSYNVAREKTNDLIHTNYGPQVFERTFFELSSRALQGTVSPRQTNPLSSRVLSDGFLTLDLLRCLYDPVPYYTE